MGLFRRSRIPATPSAPLIQKTSNSDDDDSVSSASVYTSPEAAAMPDVESVPWWLAKSPQNDEAPVVFSFGGDENEDEKITDRTSLLGGKRFKFNFLQRRKAKALEDQTHLMKTDESDFERRVAFDLQCVSKEDFEVKAAPFSADDFKTFLRVHAVEDSTDDDEEEEEDDDDEYYEGGVTIISDESVDDEYDADDYYDDEEECDMHLGPGVQPLTVSTNFARMPMRYLRPHFSPMLSTVSEQPSEDENPTPKHMGSF